MLIAQKLPDLSAPPIRYLFMHPCQSFVHGRELSLEPLREGLVVAVDDDALYLVADRFPTVQEKGKYYIALHVFLLKVDVYVTFFRKGRCILSFASRFRLSGLKKILSDPNIGLRTPVSLA